tara:strand:+ start:2467 stop:4836 length:2370 start_codon:yes stop_codon:yes gene_type:complete
MVSNQKLFTVGNFDFRLQHLLIIGVLALSVSISMIIRSTPMMYGFELFEFDPFFNYRATEYILDNGSDAYFNWIDDKSWYPYGRNISETSQVTLHFTSAIFYSIFNFGSSLYQFTILFPIIIGSLTGIIVFAFVRVLGGTTAGLFAALIFSLSVPIFSRGLIGWFKSEPLGLFFAFLALYLFVSGIKSNRGKISFIKLIFAGLFLSLGLSAWGGILFFLLPIIVYYFALPFFRKERNFLLWSTSTFSVSLIIFSLAFERTSSFIVGYAGLAILLPTIFIIITQIITKYSSEKTYFRNSLGILIAFIVSGIGIVNSGFVGLPSFRYLNAVNPFLTTSDPLTDSVAEHMTTSLTLSFGFLSVFLIFGLIGIWFLFSKKTINIQKDMRVFALISGFIAIYVSSAFVRLELFASVGLIILGSIGLAILLQKILQQKNQRITKIIFPFIIGILFLIPVSFPEDNAWTEWANFPPSILNGGSLYNIPSTDWPETMVWLRQNTPDDAVVAAWWDYGYWITSLGQRTTLVDNSTLYDFQIKKMAYVLMTDPNSSWHILHSDYSTDISKYIDNETIKVFEGTPENEFLLNYQSTLLFGESSDSEISYDSLTAEQKFAVDEFIVNNGLPTCQPVLMIEAEKLGVKEQTCNPVTKGMNADYILVYLVGERFYVDGSNIPLYTLEGGGDESKKVWFSKISNHQPSKFVQNDNISPTNYFMENTTLGNLIPFSVFKYVELNTGRTFDEYIPGLIPIYIPEIKFNDPQNDPFYLVYASPSFYSQKAGHMSTVLIYKINPDYNY